jgi:hypothetical protein
MPSRRILKLTLAAVTIASAMGLATASAASAAAASASPTAVHAAGRGTPAPGAVRPQQAYDECPSGYYCDYAETDGHGSEGLPCFYASISLSDWAELGCPSESFANRTSGLVRLYYLGGYGGAWVCIDAGAYSNNLAGYKFNNGSGKTGYGSSIENHIGSSSVASGSCSNPLPWA